MKSSYRRIQKTCFSSLFAPNHRPVFSVPPIKSIYADFEYKVANLGREGCSKHTFLVKVAAEASGCLMVEKSHYWQSKSISTGRSISYTEFETLTAMHATALTARSSQWQQISHHTDSPQLWGHYFWQLSLDLNSSPCDNAKFPSIL